MRDHSPITINGDRFNIDPASVPLEQIPAMIATLAGLELALAARLLEVGPASSAEPKSENEDQMLTVRECADRLRKSTKWVYRRTKTLPFARCLGPRSWVFSQRGLEKWLAQRRT
jgi:predicted DNA-binding transcriptional regulator AlpA